MGGEGRTESRGSPKGDRGDVRRALNFSLSFSTTPREWGSVVGNADSSLQQLRLKREASPGSKLLLYTPLLLLVLLYIPLYTQPLPTFPYPTLKKFFFDK
jgi:hypothetical protein